MKQPKGVKQKLDADNHQFTEVMSKMSLMNLDKLIAMRDKVSDQELPVTVKELCERYEKLYTGAINDVLREFTLVDQALPSEIMPLRDEMKACGIAFTIKSSKDPTISGEMDTRAQMLDAMAEDCFCVWDTGGENEAAHWGEVMTAASKVRGAKGAVIDGGLRDTVQVLEQKFPVFYKYRTSNGSLSRCKITAYQVPIKIGKVIIKPGDIIFADIDGVVVVPRDIAYAVLTRAEEIKKNESAIRSWVQSGVSAVEVVKKGGYF
jgi:4-hydroxy-4-methyl-2-oxoglutarate aldolase